MFMVERAKMPNEMRFIFTKIIMLELMLPYSGVLTPITLLNFGIGKNYLKRIGYKTV